MIQQPLDIRRITSEIQKQLLISARQSIQTGLQCGRALKLDTAEGDPIFACPAATFVTLRLQGELRGCIGRLDAGRPLIVDVAENAYAAAFSDYRFSQVMDEDELKGISISISILTPPEPINFRNERDLLNQLRPGSDGLILSDGFHRGTFLPSVWKQLSTPKLFLTELKRKAGLSPGHWSKSIRIERYTTLEFGEEDV